jgi:8-oxo-dGTP pyrophosphatase MutT (NUDIX family)
VRLIDLAHRLRRRVLAITGRPTRGVKALVRDPAGRVLLVRHSYGRTDLWMLPGGGIGGSETIEAAVRREVMEEVGCALERLDYVAPYAARAEGRRDTVHLFRARTRDTPVADAVEIAEARFFAPDALPDTVSPATLRRIAEEQGTRERDGRW